MAKVLTVYMAFYNAEEETQQPTNATYVQKMQRLPFDKIVGMPLAVNFGLILATYVMQTIASSDNWILLLNCIITTDIMSPTLISFTPPFRVCSPTCQLKQQMNLQGNDMLPEQLEFPSFQRFTLWSSARGIYLTTTAQHVCQRQWRLFSNIILEVKELGVG
jgi:hypothetical protein